ncbi:hypothetical protein EB796_002872 [Bugula neritina]|uniref:PBC domain-containing protein n=1 Tax=Bugula neritina TaxID=10212 RepID=A0A7J7KJD5_BUGNE|nr:hypothetical protein EB796_002872 [Bugula neritina]
MNSIKANRMAPALYQVFQEMKEKRKHAEYKNKLAQIRTIYHQEIDKYEQACSEFTGHALKVLSRQNTIRPINQTEIDSQVARIEGEFSKVEHLLKNDTCASVMRLRNEFLDARPRKRNFSRQATEKLNTYFYSNTHRQYPSEEAKLELAKSCNISLSQVGASDEAFCTTSMRHIISQAAGGYNPGDVSVDGRAESGYCI